MSPFFIALTNVLVTLFYLIPGFVVRKMHKVDERHLPTLSAILVYIGTPFLEISMFLTLDFDPAFLLDMGIFFLITMFTQASFMALVFLFSKDKQNARTRILVISSTMGNVGFFGLPIARALLPDIPELPCYIAMYMLSMNLLAFTVGVFAVTGDKKYISVRALLFNPTTFGLLFAFPCFLFGLKNYLPVPLINAISSIGNLTTPLCMFILGIRLASAPLKNLFSSPRVFLAPLLKLVAYPLFAFGFASLLPVSDSIKAVLLVVSAVPCASVILSLSEMYEGDSAFSANCLLSGTLLCFITIPLLVLLL